MLRDIYSLISFFQRWKLRAVLPIYHKSSFPLMFFHFSGLTCYNNFLLSFSVLFHLSFVVSRLFIAAIMLSSRKLSYKNFLRNCVSRSFQHSFDRIKFATDKVRVLESNSFRFECYCLISKISTTIHGNKTEMIGVN